MDVRRPRGGTPCPVGEVDHVVRAAETPGYFHARLADSQLL